MLYGPGRESLRLASQTVPNCHTIPAIWGQVPLLPVTHPIGVIYRLKSGCSIKPGYPSPHHHTPFPSSTRRSYIRPRGSEISKSAISAATASSANPPGLPPVNGGRSRSMAQTEPFCGKGMAVMGKEDRHSVWIHVKACVL